jgi:hypothetical protein
MNEFDEIKQVFRLIGDRLNTITAQQERTQRHLDVLIDVVDGLIRDRRFKDVEDRLSALEVERGK